MDSSSKEQIEAAIKDVRDSLTSEDVSEINAKTAALLQAFHAVSEQMYAQAAQAQQGGDGAASGENGASTSADEEEVVDAEVVDEGDDK